MSISPSACIHPTAVISAEAELGDNVQIGAYVVVEGKVRLGADCVAGASMYTVSDKFRVRVYVRDINHFREFLPGSPLARQIADAVYLYLGLEYDWDMELAIPAGQITPVRLGRDTQIGWTSWMSPNWAKTDETVRRDARFHLVSRLESAK